MPYYTDNQPFYEVMCYHAWYDTKCYMAVVILRVWFKHAYVKLKSVASNNTTQPTDWLRPSVAMDE